MSVRIGQFVQYISTEGHTKVALVTATPDTITPGTALAEQVPLNADQEQVHLMVFAPATHASPRFQVPSEAAVQGIEDFAKGGFYRPLEV